MLAAFLITLREGLEAALIVGIVLSVLRRLGKSKQAPSVWWGVLAAAAASIAGGVALNALGIAFEGRGEQTFEGFAMLTAAGVLTWMIFWMQRQSRNIGKSLASEVEQAIESGTSTWALFSLAFVAVMREGIETVLFLTAAVFGSTPGETLLGGGLGLVVAIALGWLIFVGGRELNLKRFFSVTGLLLLLFAAGLAAHGVHELQEARLLPVFVEQMWDLNPLLDENGTLGSFLKALFGYNGNPTLLEVIVYGLYLVVIGRISLRSQIKVTPAQKPVAASNQIKVQ
ncbi:MAG: FTR1 family protein [Anaerolineae bacterium]|nr:FTR1 family protein [Anaerolineae bacterium]